MIAGLLETLVVASLVETLERAIREGEEPATAALRDAIVGGASTDGLTERLVMVMASLYGTARDEVAFALTVDLIRRGDVAAWLALGVDESVLIRAEEAGIDVRAAILALPAAPRITGTEPAVARWCLRDPARTADLVANLGVEAALRCAAKLNDLAPWLSRLGEAVATLRDPSLRAEAAVLLRCGVEKDCTLDAAVREVLRGALEDDTYYGNPAEEAARALTLAGEPGLDRDPRRAVRIGAWRARPSFLGLLDPEPENRRLIARGLLEQIGWSPSLCPSRDETQCLFAEVLDPVVAEVVYAVIDRGDVAATVVAGVEPKGAARHLVAAAHAVLANEPAPVCRTCREIPRSASSRNYTPPEAVTRGLTPLDFTIEGDQRARCIECGAEYEMTSVDASDIYVALSITLTRLLPTDPVVMARWLDRLDHPEAWVRRDAAWIVANAGNQTWLEDMMLQPDAEVRREAWARLPLTRRGLDDLDDGLRAATASRLAATADVATLVDLLGRDPAIAGATAEMIETAEPEVVQALRARLRGPFDAAFGSVCEALHKHLDPAIVDEGVAIMRTAAPAVQLCVMRMLGPSAELDYVTLLRQPETRRAAIELLEHRPASVACLDMLATVLDREHRNLPALNVFARALPDPTTRAAAVRGFLALLETGNAYDAARKLHDFEIPLGDAIPHLLGRAAKTQDGYLRSQLVQIITADAQRRGDTALVTSLVEHPHPAIARLARAALR